MASPARAATAFVYVGNAGSNEIYVFELDRQRGDLTIVENVSIPGIEKPGGSTPMALSPDRRFLYVGTRGKPKVAAGFAIHPTTGRLKHVASGPLADSMAYIHPVERPVPGPDPGFARAASRAPIAHNGLSVYTS